MPCPSITGTRNCISINQTALIQPHNQRCPPTIVERRGTILWFACQPFIHGHEPRRSPCITSRPEEQKSSGVRLDKLLPIRINLCGRYRRGGGPVKPVGASSVRRAVPRKSGDVPTDVVRPCRARRLRAVDHIHLTPGLAGVSRVPTSCSAGRRRRGHGKTQLMTLAQPDQPVRIVSAGTAHQRGEGVAW